MEKLKDTFDISEIAGLLGVPNPDEFEYNGDAYHFTFMESIKEGLSDSEAEEKAQTAEQDEQDEQFHQIYDAIESVAGTFFEYHGLELNKIVSGKRSGMYRVTPVKDWLYTASCIRQTVNGVGYFYFATDSDFLDSGPYTARQAVLTHLHWIKYYAEVYGESSPKAQYRRHLR